MLLHNTYMLSPEVLWIYLKINEKNIAPIINTIIARSIAQLLSCSEISVTNPKWTCKDSKNEQICNVVFAVTNKSDESVSTAILIRAYHRVSKGKGAISNVLMGEKTIKMILPPNEQFFLNETLVVNGAVSMIIATSINDKK